MTNKDYIVAWASGDNDYILYDGHIERGMLRYNGFTNLGKNPALRTSHQFLTPITALKFCYEIRS